ncbi:MAG: RidA family protein [Pseudomonadota bacterium]
MAETVSHNPSTGIYPATDDYIHAIEVRNATRTLYVSGTMGLDISGRPAEGLQAQLELIWANIKTILASADMGIENIVRITSYMRDGDYASANEAARLRALGGHRVPTTALVAQTLSDDWLVEVEIIAAD